MFNYNSARTLPLIRSARSCVLTAPTISFTRDVNAARAISNLVVCVEWNWGVEARLKSRREQKKLERFEAERVRLPEALARTIGAQ